MGKILPILLLLLGSGAGVGAGVFLRAPSEPEAANTAEAGAEGEQGEQGAEGEAQGDGNHGDEDHGNDGHGGGESENAEKAYVKLNNQFVIPVVKGEKVIALVVMALSVEVPQGQTEFVFSREPKLRDSFLQVMFDHANVGGFEGAFTNANNMKVLRNALREVAQKDLGKEIVSDVLILDIARQDY
ncbi:MAG: flagellar basal body-associated protein FliL [Sulfitobacter sp.]